MSTTKKKQQTTDTITAALDALAGMLASRALQGAAAGTLAEASSEEATAVGSFLLAYRRERDERATRKGAA